MKSKLEQWEAHKAKWQPCAKCPVAAHTHKKCLYRGKLPEAGIDVLFVGEAPGAVENERGIPFVGPSGDVLDDVIAHLKRRFVFTYGITNIVACLPDLDGGYMTPPSDEQVENCSPRLKRIVKIASPKFFVFLGQSAAKRSESVLRAYAETERGKDIIKNLKKKMSAELVDLLLFDAPHPAYILRQNGDWDVVRLRYQDLYRKHFDRLADVGLLRRKETANV